MLFRSSPEMGATLGRYLLWASILPNTTWYGDKEQKRRHQRAAIGGLMRGVGALVAVVGLLALHDAVPLQYSPWSDAFWMMWLFYFFTVACLTLLALPLQLLGIAVAPVLRVPPLARSPRDFWGRRWNLWFTRLAHIHVFTPLGGAKRPMRASAAVFLISALSHEAMTWVSLGQIDGRMFLFFTMHGVATMATGALGTSLGRRELMPRALAVPLHLTWLAATAPLFFGPINDIFQLTAWPAWVWNILGI